MDDSIQETDSVTRNDKASGVGLPTTTTSHFSNTHKWCYTNNIHDFQRKESRFLSIFPYRECSVISVLYLCCLPGTGFLYNQSCDCVCDVMSDVPLYHATLWCPFIAVSPIDLSPLKFIYHLLNHLLLNDPLFWSDRHRLNYSGPLVFWRG